MYLTNFDPITRDFERIVRRAFGPGAIGTNDFGTVLPMDAVRRSHDVVLRFDIPGVDPQAIDITVEHGVLTVSAKREEVLGEGDHLISRERPLGSFTRRLTLSDNLDTSAIEATNANGVLEIRIPVREESKPRKITVGTAKELDS
jgi:HSP20 family protein